MDPVLFTDGGGWGGEFSKFTKKEEGLGKGLVLLNLISSYVNSAQSYFWKVKMLVTFVKLIHISE